MLHLKYLIVESASGGIMKGADSPQAREIFFWWEAVMTGMRRQGKGGIIAGERYGEENPHWRRTQEAQE